MFKAKETSLLGYTVRIKDGYCGGYTGIIRGQNFKNRYVIDDVETPSGESFPGFFDIHVNDLEILSKI